MLDRRWTCGFEYYRELLKKLILPGFIPSWLLKIHLRQEIPKTVPDWFLIGNAVTNFIEFEFLKPVS
jgi:hypothetical protein